MVTSKTYYSKTQLDPVLIMELVDWFDDKGLDFENYEKELKENDSIPMIITRQWENQTIAEEFCVKIKNLLGDVIISSEIISE